MTVVNSSCTTIYHSRRSSNCQKLHLYLNNKWHLMCQVWLVSIFQCLKNQRSM